MAIELPPIMWSIPPEGYPEDWVVPSVGDIENFRRSALLGAVATHAQVLHQRAIEVKPEGIVAGKAESVMRKLYTAIEAEIAVGRSVAGYAGPQADEGMRVLMARLSGMSGMVTMIDPLIVDAGAHGDAMSEGCFSAAGATGLFTRPAWLDVAYYDEYGDYHRPKRYEGYDARVLGHEIDHLNGILPPDRVLEQGNPLHWVPAEVLQVRDAQGLSLYRLHMQCPDPKDAWPFVVPVEQWQALSDGRLRMDHFTLPSAA